MKKTIASLFCAALAFFALASCNKSKETPAPQSNTYVLVHGAWQAPYVWDAVRADLESKGQRVVVVELPGHGSDTTPTYSLSIDAYREKVVSSISNVDGKVILVGHSMGGMVVTSVAEKIPGKISKLVYIGAFLPASGQSLEELASSDPDSRLGRSLSQSSDKLTLDVNRQELTNLFISDGSQTEKKRVLANYRPEPAIPFSNKVTLTNENFGSVAKVYIKTMQDIVISPNLQNRMISTAGVKTVYEVNTSHSPFLSQPHMISELLIKAGN